MAEVKELNPGDYCVCWNTTPGLIISTRDLTETEASDYELTWSWNSLAKMMLKILIGREVRELYSSVVTGVLCKSTGSTVVLDTQNGTR